MLEAADPFFRSEMRGFGDECEITTHDFCKFHGVFCRPWKKMSVGFSSEVWRTSGQHPSEFVQIKPSNEFPWLLVSCFSAGAISRNVAARGWHGVPLAATLEKLTFWTQKIWRFGIWWCFSGLQLLGDFLRWTSLEIFPTGITSVQEIPGPNNHDDRSSSCTFFRSASAPKVNKTSTIQRSSLRAANLKGGLGGRSYSVGPAGALKTWVQKENNRKYTKMKCILLRAIKTTNSNNIS